MISCDLSTFLAPQPTPPAPGAVDTIVAETAAAAATQTAAATLSTVLPTLTPSFTPVPSKTPSPTPSITPTFLFILPTFTRTSTPITPTTDYACQLTAQSPANKTTMAPKQEFQADWTVKNTGINRWDANGVDFVYLSGDKLSKLMGADLPKSIATGESISLTISMTAPKASGTYKTVWTLQANKTQFCRLSLTIVVSK